jgi:hypothetical protein
MRYNNALPYSALKDLGIEVVYENIFAKIGCDLPTDVTLPDNKAILATPLYDFGEGFVPAETGATS